MRTGIHVHTCSPDLRQTGAQVKAYIPILILMINTGTGLVLPLAVCVRLRGKEQRGGERKGVSHRRTKIYYKSNRRTKIYYQSNAQKTPKTGVLGAFLGVFWAFWGV